MSIKTPEQVADEYVATFTWPRSERIFLSDAQLADVLIAAIKADRAQRAEIHPDYRDDQENVRGASRVEVAWTVYDGDRIAFQSDMELTGDGAVGMFQGIGEAANA